MKKRGPCRTWWRRQADWKMRNANAVGVTKPPLLSLEIIEKSALERENGDWASACQVMLPTVLWDGYLTQALLFCCTRLPPEVTILLLASYLKLLFFFVAMCDPLLDHGVWTWCVDIGCGHVDTGSDFLCSQCSASHPWPWEFLLSSFSFSGLICKTQTCRVLVRIKWGQP